MAGKNIHFTEAEAAAFTHLAQVSHMDCWFVIGSNGRVRDLEHRGSAIGIRTAVRDLIEGTSEYDLQQIGHHDTLVILGFLSRIV